MPNLHKSASNYWEAKLQIRPYNKIVVDYVKKQIIKDNIMVAKEENKKFGTDFYLSSRHFVLRMGRQLKKVFKGTTITSRKLFTKDRLTSKNVYRVTVCFRLKEEEN